MPGPYTSRLKRVTRHPRGWSRAIATSALALTFLLTALSLTAPACAHETDQYTVPIGKHFADLSDYISNLAYDALTDGINKSNARTRRALARHASQTELEELNSPDEIANDVFQSFTSAVVLIEEIEGYVERTSSKRKYPGRIVGFQDFSYIYDNNLFPLDPRQVFKIWRASTIKVGNTYLGTDKIGHFTDMGRNYYKEYRATLKAGKTKDQAIAAAVHIGTHDPFLGERGVLGFVSSGVYSNADLAANYAGLKFYINLTEPTMVAGKLRPPMLVRDGEYWALAPYVAKDSDFVLVFMTDHLDEVLNPCLLEKSMRKPVREAIEARGDRVLAWYVDANGMQRQPAYFDRRIEELRTYFGEDYGWWDDDGSLITVSNSCYAPIQTQTKATSSAATQLLTAAFGGDPQMVAVALEEGAPIDARLMPTSHFSHEAGDTALHLAARRGAVDELHLLLEAGADIAATNERHVTPLHMAAHQPRAAQKLLDAGAPVNTADDAGHTPLDWACLASNADVAEMLLNRGADIATRDHNGQTALHLAANAGQVDVIKVLLDHGADVNAKARYGTTPLHLAALQNNADAVRLLIQHGANVNAADEFGITPLHDAARLGHIETVRALLENGADANARDAYNTTPLHLAARHDRPTVATLLLDHGADMGAGNDFGNSPVQEAKRMKSKVTSALFTQRSKQ